MCDAGFKTWSFVIMVKKWNFHNLSMFQSLLLATQWVVIDRRNCIRKLIYRSSLQTTARLFQTVMPVEHLAQSLNSRKKSYLNGISLSIHKKNAVVLNDILCSLQDFENLNFGQKWPNFGWSHSSSASSMEKKH